MKDKKLLSDIKEYLKCYENQVLEDWYELIRHISVSETGEGIETCCDWIQKKMEVPVNVIFVFEGDEECGSRGLEEFLAEHRTELAADLVFFSDGPKDPSGLPIIALGAKGD